MGGARTTVAWLSVCAGTIAIIVFEPTTAIAQTQWKADDSGNFSGNWSDANHWTAGVPGVGSSVTIDATAHSSYTVTLNTNPSLGAFTLNSDQATLLANSRILDVSGAVVIDEGALNFDGTTLRGGTIDLGGTSVLSLKGSSLIGFSSFLTSGTLSVSGAGAAEFLTNGSFGNSGVISATSTSFAIRNFTSFNNFSEIASFGATTMTIRGAEAGTATFSNTDVISASNGLGISKIGSGTNSGTIEVLGGSFGISESGTFRNFGQIGLGSGVLFTVGAGVTFEAGGGGTVQGNGSFLVNQGTLNVSGAFAPAVSSWELRAATVDGGGTLTNNNSLTLDGRSTSLQNVFQTSLVNNGSMTVLGNGNTFNSTLTNNLEKTIVVSAASGSNGGMALNQGMTNRGVLLFSGTNTDLSSAGGGTLSNESTGRIDVTSGTSFWDIALDNGGDINVAGTLEIEKIGADHSNAGTIDVTTGSLTFKDFANFTNSGQITSTNSAQIDIAGRNHFNGAPPSFFTNAGSAHITANNGLSIRQLDTFTNAGTITVNNGFFGVGLLEKITNSGTIGIGASSQFVVSGGITIENTGGGQIQGAGVFVVRDATLRVSGSFTPAIANWTLDGATVNGGGTLTNDTSLTVDGRSGGTNAIEVPFVNSGTMVVNGVSNNFANTFTNAADGIVTVQVTGGENAGMLLNQGATNRNVMRFQGSSGRTTDLSSPVAAPATLANESIGQIDVTGGPSFFTVALDNRGSINVASSLTLDAVNVDHVNSGTITLTGSGLTFDSFANLLALPHKLD